MHFWASSYNIFTGPKTNVCFYFYFSYVFLYLQIMCMCNEMLRIFYQIFCVYVYVCRILISYTSINVTPFNLKQTWREHHKRKNTFKFAKHKNWIFKINERSKAALVSNRQVTDSVWNSATLAIPIEAWLCILNDAISKAVLFKRVSLLQGEKNKSHNRIHRLLHAYAQGCTQTDTYTRACAHTPRKPEGLLVWVAQQRPGPRLRN